MGVASFRSSFHFQIVYDDPEAVAFYTDNFIANNWVTDDGWPMDMGMDEQYNTTS